LAGEQAPPPFFLAGAANGSRLSAVAALASTYDARAVMAARRKGEVLSSCPSPLKAQIELPYFFS